ncbi:ABC transporter ATP-binding protein [Aliicoccus persicus]|uniref:Carnitine transport ATP-binding protein OpuCA n=1 Tax=Aliicoccus persicus TaxID=930138 RepID=A0A662Z508_9STAP|nr:ABC transporter ATP-binding protein [Aliicoccus persicus]SEW15069.1 iron(III) transport system ATP-binding protein [Aliicoccus persicus]
MKTIIKNVHKSFGDTQVLHDISLEIESDEFVVLIGPSGCGKTTLLKIVAGFIPPTDGTVEMDNHVVATSSKIVPPNKRNLSMVFQNFALWPHYDVRKQLLFPLNHHRYISKEIRGRKEERIDEVLEMVGLSEYKHRYPHELSGGQKQRVALARALAAQPGLMLMDEPLSSLDAHLKQEIRNEIKKISQNVKSSFLYVTHDQSEALSLADKIVVMNKGRIEQVGTPEEIYNFPENPFVARFVGKHNLLNGMWHDDVFVVDDVVWRKDNVSEAFKQKGMIPLRPDELKIVGRGSVGSRSGDGGTVGTTGGVGSVDGSVGGVGSGLASGAGRGVPGAAGGASVGGGGSDAAGISGTGGAGSGVGDGSVDGFVNGLPGIINSVYFQGNQYELNVDTKYGELKLFEPIGKWQVGDKVQVGQR